MTPRRNTFCEHLYKQLLMFRCHSILPIPDHQITCRPTDDTIYYVIT